MNLKSLVNRLTLLRFLQKSHYEKIGSTQLILENHPLMFIIKHFRIAADFLIPDFDFLRKNSVATFEFDFEGLHVTTLV
ncbi:hypothetical protein [Belliella calami]|uniref:hypothetical protein n=1 Tax=Belliella calami TaxID=2923436 RepID=UPI001F4B770C|nr:hypothetical protein [Belliella calami]